MPRGNAVAHPPQTPADERSRSSVTGPTIQVSAPNVLHAAEPPENPGAAALA